MLPITAPMSAPRGAPYEANREPPAAETFISEWTAPKIAAIVVNQSTSRSWLDGWGNGIGGRALEWGRPQSNRHSPDRPPDCCARGGYNAAAGENRLPPQFRARREPNRLCRPRQRVERYVVFLAAYSHAPPPPPPPPRRHSAA